MSNEQKLPLGEPTKTHGNEIPNTDGTLTQQGLPLSDPTGIQSTPPTATWNPKADHAIPGYEILERLGHGGMGVVHLARDLHADRLVALKRMLFDSDQGSEVSRFRTEAQSMARLDHPQIVKVFDVSEYEGKPYFTMEYCPGGSLADYLDHKPQTSVLAASICEKIALAVQHAHEKDIAHRDLKPGNILIAARLIPLPDHSNSDSSTNPSPYGLGKESTKSFSAELLRITDFGLAKRLDTDAGLTRTEAVIGTPSYMAPEQATSTKQAGPQADIWAIGVMLYEMITGSLPFVGADSLEVMDNLRTKDPVPPSEKVKVPKDLETICLKCLRKEPKDRYSSAQALAEDLRAFLEERSISARPMSRLEKSAKWVKKNPSWAAMISLFVITLLAGTGISLYYAGVASSKAGELQVALKDAKDALEEANKQKTRRALAQVDTLLSADPRAVPNILKNLEESSEEVLPRLKEFWHVTESAENRSRRLRVALALLPVETEMVRDRLIQGMLEVSDPSELVVIRDTLKPFMNSRTDSLWKQLESKDVTPDQKLRLLAALAAFDEKNPKWKSVGETILQPWLSDNPLYLGTWTDALRPVRLSLIPAVENVFRGEILPEFKQIAANILADYASDQPETLSSLIPIGDDRQFKTLFPVLEKHKQQAIALLRKEAAKVPPKDDFPVDKSIKSYKPIWSEAEQEAFAKKRSGAAMALSRLGDSESVWPVLKSSPYPEARSRAIHRLASTGNDAKVLVDQLKIEKDVGIRRALILSLGEYSESQIPFEVRQPLIEMLLKWYREDSDSGIHGAIDWLLRPEKDGLVDRPLKWGQKVKLEAIDRERMEKVRRERISSMVGTLFSNPKQPISPAMSPFSSRLAEKSTKSGEWWMNGQGQTFAIVESRDPFVMGSPEDETGRRNGETLHWRKINRKFGMQTKAVTVMEFQRFLKANPKIRWSYPNELKQYAPDGDCPMVIVSWWESAQYCRWLSEQEGIPEWEMVYPSVEEIEKAKNDEKPLVLPENHLSRQGYRLSSEAEWEYLARSGSGTSYSYGSSMELLPRYCWYNENSKDRSWPLGQKKPNDWGLFDLHGNSFTWCQESGMYYLEGTQKNPVLDNEDKQSITEKLPRSLRGGSFVDHPNEVRSSFRFIDRPSLLYNSTGLRLCRTFD